MIQHYLKIAIRTLRRNKTYSAINILGLAVGIGVCLLIFQYIQFELSYDQFHDQAANTYRVQLDQYQGASIRSSNVSTPHKLGSSVQQSVPELHEMVRIRPMHQDEGVVIKEPVSQQTFLEYDIYYVDPSFLTVFNYPLKSGYSGTALDDLNSVVITSQTAEKYFGNSDPMGKTLSVKGGNLTGDFIVTGVLEDLPSNTHLQFDFLLPLDFMLSNYGIYKRSNGWDWFNFYTYVTLSPGANPVAVAEKFTQTVQANLGNSQDKDGTDVRAGLHSLKEIHLETAFSDDLARNTGSSQNIWFYGVIGLMILAIAWVNFINLSTAQAIRREKEVGIRKCLGVKRSSLVAQFLTESVLINATAAGLGIFIAYSLLPLLNEVIGLTIEFTILTTISSQLTFVAIVLAGAILSGLYPAAVLSSFRPLSLFHSSIPKWKGNLNLRKGLIGLQFFISILLIAGTYVVYKQISFIHNQDMGVNMEQIIIVPGPRVVIEEGREQLPTKYQTFKTNVINHHTIAAVTGTSNIPGKGVIYSGAMKMRDAPNEEAVGGDVILVDHHFTNAYDLEFVAGKEFTADLDSYDAVILNEKAIEALQFNNPIDAIGQNVVMIDMDTFRIQGVVKDMHWNSLHEKLSPTMYVVELYNAYFSVRANLSDPKATLAHLETTFAEVFPNDPFEYYFLDDAFNRQYQAEQQFGKLFTAFTLLAIFLACVGLFALVSFSTTIRTKEISIRKILGASVGNLMMLLSKEYLLLLGIAGLLAIPAVIFGAQSWLENYAYRIGIGLDIFIIPIILLLVIAACTIGYRTYLSSTANPVDSLRNE